MDFIDRLQREDEIILFGQNDYLARVASYLHELFPALKQISLSFSLSNEKIDSTEFDFSIFDEELKILEKELVLVTFSEKFHAVAGEHLKRCGFTNLVFYNSVLDNTLKKRFFAAYFRHLNKEYVLLEKLSPTRSEGNERVHIYQAKSIYDKNVLRLSNDLCSSCFIPIQVGAALTDRWFADQRDDVGENISVRNRHYSEMTAFYWMWKNDKDADYLGLCHYRRLWVDLDTIIEKLQTTDIDAVLPLPTLCENSVHEDYLLRYIPTVWQPMMEVMKRRSPDYYEAAQEIFKGKIFYASNMCILRRNVLDDLCKWMFPIVMEVEEIVGDIKDPYYNRYAGFCTERLITLYFLYNKHHWKIAHAEKVFIG